MIILEHGDTYNIATCKKCNAKFGYVKTDIHGESRMDDYFGEIHTHSSEWVTCPECRTKFYLKYEIDAVNM